VTEETFGKLMFVISLFLIICLLISSHQKQIANIIFATAAQRAEAFLKALNLWIE
jgi:hypothetical protein